MENEEKPAQNTNEPRKRPGRPPKKRLTNVHFETFGIVEKPSDPENVLEMEYENPRLFKRIFSLYKGFGVNEITWNFLKDRVEIATKDHKGKSNILTTIFGNMLIHYYCAEPMSRCVKRGNLERIFKTLDKNHTKITFILRHQDSRSLLYMIIKDSEIDFEHNYDIELIQKNVEIMINNNNDDSDYPIKFSLPSKNFKKIVQDVSISSQHMTIKKQKEDEPLTIGYECAKQINFDGIFKNPNKIELKSSLDPGDIFSCSVNVSYIQPFSNSNIGEKVYIAVDKTRPISFTTEVDRKKYNKRDGTIVEGPVCSIKIFTDIVSFKAE